MRFFKEPLPLYPPYLFQALLNAFFGSLHAASGQNVAQIRVLRVLVVAKLLLLHDPSSSSLEFGIQQIIVHGLRMSPSCPPHHRGCVFPEYLLFPCLPPSLTCQSNLMIFMSLPASSSYRCDTHFPACFLSP